MTNYNIKFVSVLFIIGMLAGCSGNKNNREIIFIDLSEDANAGFFRNKNELPRILLEGLKAGALVPYQIDYFGNGAKAEITLDSLNKFFAIPYAEDLDPEEKFSPYVSDLFLVGLDRIFNKSSSGVSHVNLYYAPEVMPDGTRQYLVSLEYEAVLNYLQDQTTLWYSNALINPDDLRKLVNPAAAEFYSLAEALSLEKYVPSERREISKEGIFIISSESDNSAIPANPIVSPGNHANSIFVIRATQAVNLASQPEILSNNYHALAKALLIPALDGQLAAYKSDSLMVILDPAAINERMLMPPKENEQTSKEQYPIVEITLARLIYDIEFLADGSETKIVPAGVALFIPGDLMPDGTNYPIAYFKYEDIKPALVQLEIQAEGSISNYDAAISAQSFSGIIVSHWDVRETPKNQGL